MPNNHQFWRIVALIGLAHVAAIIGLVHWNSGNKKPNREDIVWVSGDPTEGNGPATGYGQVPAKSSPTEATAASVAPTPPEDEDSLLLASARSEIQLPTATPTPAPKPSVVPEFKATPGQTPRAPSKPRPKPTLKPKPKPTPKPKKLLLTKISPKPAPVDADEDNDEQERSETDARADETASTSDQKPSNKTTERVGNSGGGGGHGGGVAKASELASYGRMLHDRLYSEWIQPTSTVASLAKMSTLVRVRIEKDGRVSSFEIVKPSGNVAIDESVAAIGKKITTVDPLPSALRSSGHYDVKINFELNSD